MLYAELFAEPSRFHPQLSRDVTTNYSVDEPNICKIFVIVRARVAVAAMLTNISSELSFIIQIQIHWQSCMRFTRTILTTCRSRSLQIFKQRNTKISSMSSQCNQLFLVKIDLSERINRMTATNSFIQLKILDTLLPKWLICNTFLFVFPMPLSNNSIHSLHDVVVLFEVVYENKIKVHSHHS